MHGICFGSQLWATITPKVYFREAINEFIKLLNQGIRRLVPAEGKGLPMIQLYLIAHGEKELDIGGAHLLR